MDRTERWVSDGPTERAVGRLQDRVVIVTGSSSGIGRAIALLFSREGAYVVCADIRETPANEGASGASGATTAELINGIYVRTDVGNSNDVRDLILSTVEQYGRLDIFVNNAGIFPEAIDPRPIWAADEDAFDMTQRTNLKGVFLGCKYASAQMRTQQPHQNGDRGWIVNIGSIFTREDAVAYCASKGGVLSLTKAVALDCTDDRIHVNAICPGYTPTSSHNLSPMDERQREVIIGQHPFRGLGIPNDIARVALFLVSEDSSWMTGTSLSVDGGYTCR